MGLAVGSAGAVPAWGLLTPPDPVVWWLCCPWHGGGSTSGAWCPPGDRVCRKNRLHFQISLIQDIGINWTTIYVK